MNSPTQTVAVFLLGRGSVAEALLGALVTHAPNVPGFRFQVAGIAGRRGGCFLGDEDSLPSPLRPQSVSGSGNEECDDYPCALQVWKQRVLDLALQQLRSGTIPILVDCSTGGEEMIEFYSDLLSHRIPVATCNKRPVVYCTPKKFAEFVDAERTGNPAFFRMGPTVGAGTQLLDEVESMMRFGIRPDVELVVSGTFNAILSNMAAGMALRAAFDKAVCDGMLEPLYRDDVLGTDAAWKAVLTARRLGLPINLSDVRYEPFVPISADATNDQVLAALDTHGGTVTDTVRAILDSERRPRYMVWFDGKTPCCGIRGVPRGHPAFELGEGANMIILRHPGLGVLPRVVSGRGAGYKETGFGVMREVFAIAVATAQRNRDLGVR